MSWAILIPISIGMGLVGVVAFVWALNSDQFDDPEGNASRVLLNETPPQPKGQTHDNLATHIGNRDT